MPYLQPIRKLFIDGIEIKEGKFYNILWKRTSGGYLRDIGRVSKIIWEENCILFDCSKDYSSNVEKIKLNSDYGIFEIKEEVIK